MGIRGIILDIVRIRRGRGRMRMMMRERERREEIKKRWRKEGKKRKNRIGEGFVGNWNWRGFYRYFGKDYG